MVERPGEQRVGGRLGDAAAGDVRPVDGLDPAEDVVVAVGIVADVLVLIEGQAVDRHGGAVLRAAAPEAFELRDVARPVELELHEGIARMAPDVVGLPRVRSGQVVRVGVGRAFLRVLGRRLRVAQGQPEPERGPELEVPRAAGAVSLGLLRRVLGEGDVVRDVVAGARDTRFEDDRWLVVPDVAAEALEWIDANRAIALTQRLAAFGILFLRRGARGCECSPKEQQPGEQR